MRTALRFPENSIKNGIFHTSNFKFRSFNFIKMNAVSYMYQHSSGIISLFHVFPVKNDRLLCNKKLARDLLKAIDTWKAMLSAQLTFGRY